nr:P-loop NTPase fold protein [uncultured Cohaesibacter sp.]
MNTAAAKALHEYTEISNPKYAFLIEAPWGTGKTHFVKSGFSASIESGDARYVSLSGVNSPQEFRRAMLAGVRDEGFAKAAATLGDTLGKLVNLKDIGSLAQGVIEDQLIKNLPRLLIFDDLERCEMSPPEVFGLINDFVEHKRKNVVLCGFLEKSEATDSENEKEKGKQFLKLKEKVIGRTVRIEADLSKALPEFLKHMREGTGKQWFLSNEELVVSIFSSSKHGNLRILRQCLHDCGRVIDVLDDDLRSSRDAMQRFVRTYLVLAMALAAGNLKPEHLADRGSHKWIMKPEEGEDPHPLYVCFESDRQAEIYTGNSASILPLDLAISLIGVGYEEPETINATLRGTNQFTGQEEMPLWRRFVSWRELPMKELSSTHQEALEYVLKSEQIEPGPYLHLAHDLISIAEDGGESAKELAEQIERRLDELSQKGLIPAARYGTQYGWSNARSFSFGGFGFEAHGLIKPLVEMMRALQLSAFKDTETDEAVRLLKLLQNDIDAFTNEFAWENKHNKYSRTEILHNIAPQDFAGVVFSNIVSGNFETIGKLLEMLASRIPHGETWTKEVEWSKKLKGFLVELAEQAGPLEKARMKWFFGFHWRFPEECSN